MEGGEVAGPFRSSPARMDAVRRKVSDGAPRKPTAVRRLLVGEDLDVGEPGGVVDAT